MPSSPASPVPAQSKDAANDESILSGGFAKSKDAVGAKDTPAPPTESLTGTYRMGTAEVQAVKNVSFTIQRGEFVALMGASGSGKSTLMHLLGAWTPPIAGITGLKGKMSPASPPVPAQIRTGGSASSSSSTCFPGYLPWITSPCR